jgi:hypothetical protein
MRLLSDFTDIIVKSLPAEVRDLLMDRGEQLCVAGGFCRDILAGKDPKDIDIFAVSKPVMDDAIDSFGWQTTWNRKNTANAVSFEQFFPMEDDIPVQFVTRVFYPDHEDLIKSFDFSVCQIAIFFSAGQWVGLCSSAFWRDITAERATYMDPERDEDPGASVIRMVRFASRGYKIGETDVANVVGRFFGALSGESKEIATDRVKKSFRRVGYAGKQVVEQEDLGRDE